MAGLGKSTITHSIAEWARSLEIVSPTFFFDRGVQELQDATLLLSTLAYQLATNPHFKRRLAKALSEVADLDLYDFTTQFERLIHEPLVTSYE